MGANSNDAILAQLDNELEKEMHEEHHRSVKNNEETAQGKLLGIEGAFSRRESPSFLEQFFTIFQIGARRRFRKAIPGRERRGEQETTHTIPLIH